MYAAAENTCVEGGNLLDFIWSCIQKIQKSTGINSMGMPINLDKRYCAQHGKMGFFYLFQPKQKYHRPIREKSPFHFTFLLSLKSSLYLSMFASLPVSARRKRDKVLRKNYP